MIDQDKLEQLIKLMVDNDLTELDLADEGERVALKRGGGQPMTVHLPPGTPGYPMPPVAGSAGPSADAGAEESGRATINSPMVGTFYVAASPDAPPFVNVGDAVTAESVVCIIEAMKVFNEIKAETAGTIARVLVDNGQAVEFGQPLFELEA